jgi:hypothetical protein
MKPMIKSTVDRGETLKYKENAKRGYIVKNVVYSKL